THFAFQPRQEGQKQEQKQEIRVREAHLICDLRFAIWRFTSWRLAIRPPARCPGWRFPEPKAPGERTPALLGRPRPGRAKAVAEMAAESGAQLWWVAPGVGGTATFRR